MPNRKRSGIKVYVAGLVPNTKPQELYKLFGKFGRILSCDVVKNMAYLYFEKIESAKAAVAAMNGSQFKCKHLILEIRSKCSTAAKKDEKELPTMDTDKKANDMTMQQQLSNAVVEQNETEVDGALNLIAISSAQLQEQPNTSAANSKPGELAIDHNVATAAKRNKDDANLVVSDVSSNKNSDDYFDEKNKIENEPLQLLQVEQLSSEADVAEFDKDKANSVLFDVSSLENTYDNTQTNIKLVDSNVSSNENNDDYIETNMELVSQFKQDEQLSSEAAPAELDEKKANLVLYDVSSVKNSEHLNIELKEPVIANVQNYSNLDYNDYQHKLPSHFKKHDSENNAVSTIEKPTVTIKIEHTDNNNDNTKQDETASTSLEDETTPEPRKKHRSGVRHRMKRIKRRQNAMALAASQNMNSKDVGHQQEHRASWSNNNRKNSMLPCYQQERRAKYETTQHRYYHNKQEVNKPLTKRAQSWHNYNTGNARSAQNLEERPTAAKDSEECSTSKAGGETKIIIMTNNAAQVDAEQSVDTVNGKRHIIIAEPQSDVRYMTEPIVPKELPQERSARLARERRIHWLRTRRYNYDYDEHYTQQHASGYSNRRRSPHYAASESNNSAAIGVERKSAKSVNSRMNDDSKNALNPQSHFDAGTGRNVVQKTNDVVKAAAIAENQYKRCKSAEKSSEFQLKNRASDDAGAAIITDKLSRDNHRYDSTAGTENAPLYSKDGANNDWSRSQRVYGRRQYKVDKTDRPRHGVLVQNNTKPVDATELNTLDNSVSVVNKDSNNGQLVKGISKYSAREARNVNCFKSSVEVGHGSAAGSVYKKYTRYSPIANRAINDALKSQDAVQSSNKKSYNEQHRGNDNVAATAESSNITSVVSTQETATTHSNSIERVFHTRIVRPSVPAWKRDSLALMRSKSATKQSD